MSAPIEPKEYLGGVKVVDIGDLRVARGMTRRPVSVCRHKSLVYDNQERRIYCKDCEKDVEPFDAFENLVNAWNASVRGLQADRLAAKEAIQFQARGRAAKAMDEAWRKRNSVPCCPHCKEAIYPEDVLPSPPTKKRKSP